MDERVDEVIKNIIYIDKSSVELKERVAKEIADRKKHILEEVAALERRIVGEEKKRIKEFEERELQVSREEAQKIVLEANQRAEDMDRIFSEKKQKAAEDLFIEILRGLEAR